ncbi:MAG: carbohydrate kinase [Clostridia bacterium]|nr:carbohydrate kinase [Clostridia bacterium]
MFDITSLGEILIDFTSQGKNEQGQQLFAQNAGGAPANVAVAVARLAGKSAFIGKAGDDMHGRFLKETLINNSVDCSAMLLDKNHFTTLAFVDIKNDGEREFSFARKHGADKMLTKEDIPLDLIKNSRVFHFGSVSLTDEPSRSATLYAAQNARDAGVTVAYDPNYRASLWENEDKAKAEMRQAALLADLIKISDEEAELMTGEADCEKAAENLLQNGAKIAVVTLGRNGAYVRTKDGGKFVKGFTVNAVDCTGAGDAFWGGFLLKVCRSGKKPDDITLDEAEDFALFGNAVASICVERCGAIPSLPKPEEAQNRLKS